MYKDLIWIDDIPYAQDELRELVKSKVDKRNLTDKAWNWITTWVFENTPHQVYDALMSDAEEYRKAMEE